jgi:hypothetical protein
MRKRTLVALVATFGLGVIAGRGTGPRAAAQGNAPGDPFAEMLHVGVVVKDLDQAVARWKAMGFGDIRVSPPSRGVDRTYHGKPIDAVPPVAPAGRRPEADRRPPVSPGLSDA